MSPPHPQDTDQHFMQSPITTPVSESPTAGARYAAVLVVPMFFIGKLTFSCKDNFYFHIIDDKTEFLRSEMIVQGRTANKI